MSLHTSQIHDLDEFRRLAQVAAKQRGIERGNAVAAAVSGDLAGMRHHIQRWWTHVGSQEYWTRRVDAIIDAGAATKTAHGQVAS